MAEAKTDPTGDPPPKTGPSNWLLIVEDVFPRWRDRLGSSADAKDELNDLLCDPLTRSARHKVDASGREIRDTNRHVDHPGFWQDRLLLVADADGGDDHLVVDYGDAYLDFYSPGHWRFFVRRLDVERWERLYPKLAALPPRPPASYAPDQQQSRPIEAPPSTAAAPAVSEVATQDVSPEAQGVSAGVDCRPPATPASPPAPATKRRRSRQQRMIQQIAAEEYPDGYDQIETGVIIQRVANRLVRQKLAVPKRDVFLRALDRRKG